MKIKTRSYTPPPKKKKKKWGRGVDYMYNNYVHIWAPLHKTMVTLQLMVSLQSMVTTIATLSTP